LAIAQLLLLQTLLCYKASKVDYQLKIVVSRLMIKVTSRHVSGFVASGHTKAVPSILHTFTSLDTLLTELQPLSLVTIKDLIHMKSYTSTNFNQGQSLTKRTNAPMIHDCIPHQIDRK
jgi:hypothetical protein